MKETKENGFGPLLTAARNGSSEALGELLDRYRGYLWVIANEEIGSNLTAKVAASDVVQETYAATYRAFDGFRGTSELELKTWLRRVLLNQVTDASRMYLGSLKRDASREISINRPTPESGRSLLSGVAGSDSTPSTHAIRHEQIASLQAALDELPPQKCAIVLRHSIHHESFESIGKSLGRSPDAIRKEWRRTLSKLVERMAAEDG